MIGALKRASDVPVILGGVGFSIMPERILEFCRADYGIVCEAEAAFPELLTRLDAGPTVEAVSAVGSARPALPVHVGARARSRSVV